jgi:CelD/BcsL family acetyltransferase involved in cellulose biosynthesis
MVALHRHIEAQEADLHPPPHVELPAETRPCRPPALSVAAFFHPGQIRALLPEWRELERRTTAPVFFQSAAWVAHVVDVYTQNPDLGPLEAVVLTVRFNDRLVAVWPLRRRRVLGTRVLHDLSDPFGQYSDLLIDPAADRAIVLDALLAYARALGDDGLVLRKVRDDSPLAALLGLAAARRAGQEAAPFVDLGLYPTFEAFHKTLKPKTRKNIRNAMNRLERMGPVQHDHLSDRRAIAAALGEAFEVRREWLSAQGLSSAAFSDPAFSRLVASLAEDDQIRIAVMRLTVGDRTAAIQWGFIAGARYYAYIAARNPVFDTQSPGKLHLEFVVRCCQEAGLRYVDLLAPAVPYKLTWATGTMPIADIVLPFTRRGRLLLGVWQQGLRPAALNLYRRLPLRIRQPIARLANRAR